MVVRHSPDSPIGPHPMAVTLSDRRSLSKGLAPCAYWALAGRWHSWRGSGEQWLRERVLLGIHCIELFYVASPICSTSGQRAAAAAAVAAVAIGPHGAGSYYARGITAADTTAATRLSPLWQRESAAAVVV